MVTTRRGQYSAEAAKLPANKQDERDDKPPQTASRVETSSRSSGLLDLSAELRLQIYAHLVVSQRPFLIGRCQDNPRRENRRSPRDFYPGKHGVERDDRPSRSIQPPITRVSRLLRKESLPLFYSENRFWLIHNEIRRHEGDTQRNFDSWLAQTPSDMFDVIQHVSLCGYTHWPTRIMITMDLKTRQLTGIREYSTYGDELEVYQPVTDSVKSALQETTADNGLTALRAVLRQLDWIYDLDEMHVSAPPGLSRLRKPQSGPEYDF